MPDQQPIPINIGNVSDGAMIEAFEKELREVLRSIADPTTPSTAKREIGFRLSMKPNDDRMQIDTVYL
jgi:hypothetical protein